MKEKIKVVVKEVNKEAKIIEIENDLDSLQEIVEGNIQIISHPKYDDIDIILNENGKLEQLEPTMYMPEYNDICVGNILFAGVDYEEGKTIGLTDEQCTNVLEYLKENQVNDLDLQDAYFLGIITGKLKQETEMY